MGFLSFVSLRRPAFFCARNANRGRLFPTAIPKEGRSGILYPLLPQGCSPFLATGFFFSFSMVLLTTLDSARRSSVVDHFIFSCVARLAPAPPSSFSAGVLLLHFPTPPHQNFFLFACAQSRPRSIFSCHSKLLVHSSPPSLFASRGRCAP